jgi:hypothetical protein
LLITIAPEEPTNQVKPSEVEGELEIRKNTGWYLHRYEQAPELLQIDEQLEELQ